MIAYAVQSQYYPYSQNYPYYYGYSPYYYYYYQYPYSFQYPFPPVYYYFYPLVSAPSAQTTQPPPSGPFPALGKTLFTQLAMAGLTVGGIIGLLGGK